MPKTTYAPTAADALTGSNLRALRQRRGETLKQTVENSGLGKDASTLAATERGERLLTDLEATKLAAHFGTTAEMLRRFGAWTADPLATRPVPMPAYSGLFPVPDPTPTPPTTEGLQRLADDVFGPAGKDPDMMLIDLRDPLTPDQYREQVWIPYLEARFAAETA